MQFMQEQLQQIKIESELVFHQIKLIKEQRNIEIAARMDSQVSFNIVNSFKFVLYSSNLLFRIRINNSLNEIENYWCILNNY